MSKPRCQNCLPIFENLRREEVVVCQWGATGVNVKLGTQRTSWPQKSGPLRETANAVRSVEPKTVPQGLGGGELLVILCGGGLHDHWGSVQLWVSKTFMWSCLLSDTHWCNTAIYHFFFSGIMLEIDKEALPSQRIFLTSEILCLQWLM